MAFEIKCELLWSDPIGGVALVRVTQAGAHAGDLRLLAASVPYIIDVLTGDQVVESNSKPTTEG